VPAGGPGDSPITDIVTYRLPVFSPEVDLLIAEIVALGGEREIRDRYGAFYWSPPSFKHELDSLRPFPDDLAGDLRAIRDRRVREGTEGGWEVDRLLNEAREGRAGA
jgi:hypothetical protein